MLEAMEDFHYIETGCSMMRSAIELLFAQYNHTVATTSNFTFMVQCMPDMLKGQQVDWVLAKVDAAGIEWLRTKATESGAEHISDLASVLDFWSD